MIAALATAAPIMLALLAAPVLADSAIRWRSAWQSLRAPAQPGARP